MIYHLEKPVDSNQAELLYLPRMADKTIDLTHEVVQAQYFEKYLAKVIEWLFANNPNLKRPTPQEQERMRTAAPENCKRNTPNQVLRLQTRYGRGTQN